MAEEIVQLPLATTDYTAVCDWCGSDNVYTSSPQPVGKKKLKRLFACRSCAEQPSVRLWLW